jgi:hypothetical protein
MVLVLEKLDDEHHERYWELLCSGSDTIHGTILADMARRLAHNNSKDDPGYELAKIRRDFDAAFAKEDRQPAS